MSRRLRCLCNGVQPQRRYSWIRTNSTTCVSVRRHGTHASNHRRKGLRSGQRHQRRGPRSVHRRRQVCVVGQRRPHDRCHRHGDFSRRRRRAHACRRRLDQLCPRDDSRRSSSHASLHPIANATQWPRRHGTDDVCHRLSVRRHGLYDGQRSRRASAVRPTHARRTERHSDRRQELVSC